MIQKILEKGILVYCIKEFIGINAVAVWYVWIQAKYNFPISYNSRCKTISLLLY